MVELELEKTYLLKELPEGLEGNRSEIISDAFVPISAKHPVLRLRHRGNNYELTKKQPIDDADPSRQNEHTIQLTPEEAAAFDAVSAKRFSKRCYYCTVDGHQAEVDIYLGDLAGLAVVDFEFMTDEALQSFTMPRICLADITQEEALAGKKYVDLQSVLQKYNYKPLFLQETN